MEGPRSEPIRPQKMLALADGVLALEDDWQEEVGAADATGAEQKEEHFFDGATVVDFEQAAASHFNPGDKLEVQVESHIQEYLCPATGEGTLEV